MTDDAEPTMLTDRVIQIVENAPGIKSADIYALIPETKSTSIAACLCHLMKQGRLDRTGTPRNFSYYLGGDGPIGASTTDGPAAQAKEFSMTSDGRLVIPFPLKTVTLDAETTRALGQFLMFTMPVWRGEAA